MKQRQLKNTLLIITLLQVKTSKDERETAGNCIDAEVVELIWMGGKPSSSNFLSEGANAPFGIPQPWKLGFIWLGCSSHCIIEKGKQMYTNVYIFCSILMLEEGVFFSPFLFLFVHENSR